MTDAFSKRLGSNDVLNPYTDVVKVAGTITAADDADLVAPMLADISADADFWDHADSGSSNDFLHLEDVWLQVDVILRDDGGDNQYPRLQKKLERILASSLNFEFTNNKSGDDAVSVSANGSLLLTPRSLKEVLFETDDVAKVALTKNASSAAVALTTAASGVALDYEFRLHLSWREAATS